jgi:hypothetical protein
MWVKAGTYEAVVTPETDAGLIGIAKAARASAAQNEANLVKRRDGRRADIEPSLWSLGD